MASFYCSVTPVDGDGTKLEVYAKFLGGASDYSYDRLIDIRVIGVGTFEFTSAETGGGTSTFSGYITGLSPGEDYEWVCNLYYWNGDWVVSDYSDEGTATTYSDSSSNVVYIYTNGWNAYVPYIYTGSWEPYDAYIYTGSWDVSG